MDEIGRSWTWSKETNKVVVNAQNTRTEALDMVTDLC